MTQGGSRSFCDELLPNPFFQVAGFEGTTRFTNPTLSRFELSRPFPAFGSIQMTERNDGKMTYDSLQFVANKRWAKGITLNANYTWVPRWTEDGANTDDRHRQRVRRRCRQQRNVGPYFSQRKHRVTASGVWELPWWRGQKNALGYLLGGWSIAPMFVFQTGQPWDMPGNVDIAPGVDLKDIALNGKKEGQFIYGVKPCVGQHNTTTGNYDLLSFSVAYGCTQPYFLIREAFQRRTANVPLRRVPPAEFLPGRHELRQDDAGSPTRCGFQLRLEAFNIFNSPMYDEVQLHPEHGIGRLRPHQPQRSADSRTSSGSSSWASS